MIKITEILIGIIILLLGLFIPVIVIISSIIGKQYEFIFVGLFISVFFIEMYTIGFSFIGGRRKK
jgi:hypothetical protein